MYKAERRTFWTVFAIVCIVVRLIGFEVERSRSVLSFLGLCPVITYIRRRLNDRICSSDDELGEFMDDITGYAEGEVDRDRNRSSTFYS